jgi:hypothetical protein
MVTHCSVAQPDIGRAGVDALWLVGKQHHLAALGLDTRENADEPLDLEAAFDRSISSVAARSSQNVRMHRCTAQLPVCSVARRLQELLHESRD